ncbi:MAG: L-threonylcarbamoyladenylate synthase [Ruminococcus flavefaciens]|nr:L-threonylcarbamoyladenylate synthase [Ruminococcus flavefaciens]MCM1231649.1 L-threonylcarbamoyladenylate synthase [Ruminococcus flavefaciens]
MNTVLLENNENDIATAGELIRQGQVVGVPTETVYGLCADARNEEAVRAVFSAKGRPADNPLIVHLADFSQAELYTSYIPELAYRLAEKFCPGALTMILPKNDEIPLITSGGLDTVGIRIPSHPVMHRVIEISGCPIAAPSANISGLPSPTCAEHVMRDMNGRISAVINGGNSQYGVESTVISFDGENNIRILRPGAVTREMLLEVCGNVVIDPAILNELAEGAVASSPGMKYKHYSPKANVVMVESDLQGFVDYVNQHNGENVWSLIFDGDENNFPHRFMTYGADSSEQAHLIFQRLRELDDIGAEQVYVRAPSTEGVGLAVYNRLIRAAGFEVIKV